MKKSLKLLTALGSSFPPNKKPHTHTHTKNNILLESLPTFTPKNSPVIVASIPNMEHMGQLVEEFS